MAVSITITSQYGTLSRGRHSARQGSGNGVTWAAKDHRGNLVIDAPGTWHLHCTDGFSRVARAIIEVDDDGSWRMIGDSKRFSVI